jgi:two-component system cell cycle sensor histidine kinase/response regulator CckA
LKTTTRAGVPAPLPDAKRSERWPWAYVLTFVLGSALVAGFMWYHIQGERRVASDHWRSRVSAIADERGRAVENWIKGRRLDAESVATSPSVRALAAGAGETSSSHGAALAQLERVGRAGGYLAVAVVDRRGQLVARWPAGADLGPGLSEVATMAIKAGALRGDLAPESKGRLLHLAQPIAGDAGQPAVGAVVLRIDGGKGLFPILADETPGTRSDEALLFRFTGEPAYLSPFRQQPGGWAGVKRSLDDLAPRARQLSGHSVDFDEMVDYRAANVFATVRLIEPVGWGLVVKIDQEEALIDFHQSGRLAGLAAIFLVLALLAFLIGLWRQQQRTALLKEQIKKERAIFNLKSYAEKIVASVPSGLLVLSGDLRILSANRSFLESFGLHHKDTLGRRLDEVIRADGLMTQIREAMHTGIVQRDVLYDLQLATRRETRPVRMTMTGIRIAEEEEARLLLTIEDLTEEERLHAARRASEQRFHDLVQTLDAIVWEADATSLRFTFVSQRAESILGYPLEHWLSEADFFAARLHPEERERVIGLFQAALAGGSDHELEFRAVAADGRAVWVRDIVHVVRDAQGHAKQLRGLTVDLTERKRADEALREREEQLRQAQKMEAVGQLAGGIAHDFNNLLMVIQGDSELILRRLPAEHAMRRNAEGIREASQQAASLTRQLLAFSRKQVLAPRIVDPNQIVANMHGMLQRLLGETIQLELVAAPDTGLVKADPGQLEQVIMNLAVNARDAMPDGGRLTIATGELELDSSAAREHSEAAPGRYVMLQVSDTGTGMDQATRTRLFEPFFTTKEQGKGTGLGLSTVYGIVKQSGGHIWVQSEIGRGSTFKICLPVAEEEVSIAEAPALAEVEAEPVRGAETILLVEDARRVREVVREILEMNGYAILEARNGSEALEIATTHTGPIHLMVTDVVMPHMSGRELAQRLAAVRPETRVLFMSGYTDDAIVRHGVLEEGTAFLSKPFTPDSLSTKVREVLNAGRTGTDLTPAAGRRNGGRPGAKPTPAPAKQTA